MILMGNDNPVSLGPKGMAKNKYPDHCGHLHCPDRPSVVSGYSGGRILDV